MMSVDFEKSWITSLAYRWRYYNKLFLNSFNKDKSRFHIIKYEDLVSEPEKYLKKLCEFLRIEYLEEMIYYNQKKDFSSKIFPDYFAERYHKSLFEPVSPKKVEQWKIKMNANEIEKCDIIVGKYSDIMGYERVYKNKNILLYIKCLPGIFYGRFFHIIFDTASLLLPYSFRKIFFKIIFMFSSSWWENIKGELDKKKLKDQSNLKA